MLSRDEPEVLQEVFCAVLENVAFMLGTPVPRNECPLDDCAYVQATVAFHGAIAGSLDLVVTTDMCHEISANVRGLDGNDDSALLGALDSLKAFINLTCRRLLSAMVGDAPVIDLEPSMTTALDRSGFAALLERPGTEPFMVEGAPVLLRLAFSP